MSGSTSPAMDGQDAALSLYQRLDPGVLANPYPLYHRLRREDPVHWDPYLHAWVVTRYKDVTAVLQRFSAERMPTPAQLTSLGLAELNPVAEVLVRQMIFMDPPNHTRLRALAAAAFTPARAEAIRLHIQEITDELIDRVIEKGRMDVIADFADLLPATVTAELMGVPVSDRDQLKTWSKDFSEMLGNFQHNPGRAALMLATVEKMTAYFRERMREQVRHPREGVVHALMSAEIESDRLSEEEIIANCIITMTGGQETTTNLIGNGLLALLQNPKELARLQADPALLPAAVEELLRYESPIQHTARLAPADAELGGKMIRKRDAVIAVIGAANHDPERFPDPDRLNITRTDNRHLAFGWAGHYCFGAPLARVEGQIAFSTVFRRLRNLRLDPVPLAWRHNMVFRGLERLPIAFEAAPRAQQGLVKAA
ncbi:MAG TPA: cytochrome P450 [Bryobacterales bacterium]|jgi:pimeloyl-[acyl-carrier protein] synthase|nr:cytochrome P450 [Bryobacterales bacterium]